MRENIILFTIDYETWHPSQNIDWDRDILHETDALLDIAEEFGVKFTFMIEMCEYIWLEQNNPHIAGRIKEQIQNIISKGHDVQLHLHPNWMPDTGARYSDGKWWWDERLANCNEYPGSLHNLVRICKGKLEEIVRVVKADYKVIAFRAGGYRVQPFSRLSKALLDNSISIDTSVYAKGKSKERGYDFKYCRNLNHPYFCSLDDPQYSSEQSGFIELPITTYGNGERLFLDNDESEKVVARFLSLKCQYFKNKVNFFNFVGHTKANHNKQALKEAFKSLQTWPGNRYETISSCFNDIHTAATYHEPAQKDISEVQEIMERLYNTIDPGPSEEVSVTQVLRDRTALCAGYSEIFYFIMKKYGYKSNRLSLTAEEMPNGRGPKKIDSHELVKIHINDGQIIVDPTVNKIYPYTIEQLFKNPELAEDKDFTPDVRFSERSYKDYSTPFFFERIIFYHLISESWLFDRNSRLAIAKHKLIGKLLEYKNNIKHYNRYRKQNSK